MNGVPGFDGWHRWLYRDGRPRRLARWMNTVASWQYAHGIVTFGGRGVTMEVPGRVSGRTVTFPLVLVRHEGERYVVSMLGERAQWVRNVRAQDGLAVLHSPHREEVRLVEVPVEQRPDLLRRYLQLAPGARPHIPVDRWAPLARFHEIAGAYPVFRVVAR